MASGVRNGCVTSSDFVELNGEVKSTLVSDVRVLVIHNRVGLAKSCVSSICVASSTGSKTPAWYNPYPARPAAAAGLRLANVTAVRATGGAARVAAIPVNCMPFFPAYAINLAEFLAPTAAPVL